MGFTRSAGGAGRSKCVWCFVKVVREGEVVPIR